MARRATVINQEREKGGFVLVLDAGNSLAADRDPAVRTRGQTSVTAMNKMGYDAMALGSTDVALGLDVIRQRMAEAEFQMLSANAFVSATGDLLAAPYVLRHFGGHNIAVVGITGREGTREISIHDPLTTAREVVANLENHADVIVLLSQAGPRTDKQIAEAIPEIDLIISGGKFDLATLTQPVESGAQILHADESSPGHAGRQMGVARLTFDGDGELVATDWQRLALRPEIADDPAMASWVNQQLTP